MKTIKKIGKYTIEKISDTEIKIDNKYQCCYAYIDADYKKLLFDVVYCPPYIQKIALSFAKKHIKTIY